MLLKGTLNQIKRQEEYMLKIKCPAREIFHECTQEKWQRLWTYFSQGLPEKFAEIFERQVFYNEYPTRPGFCQIPWSSHSEEMRACPTTRQRKPTTTACRELTTAEEDKFFKLGLFGKHDPEDLRRTVWWVLSLHFGFRARDESRKLKWRDVCISKEPETRSELLLWKAERGSKTRHGDAQHKREFYPTAQATHNERCPVQLYRAFNSQHRPDEMN
jgi:hypothetical protein